MDLIVMQTVLRDAALSGDREAWRTLYDSTQHGLSRYVHWRLAGRRDWIEDALQESWLIAAKNLSRFDAHKAEFACWLRGIASNVIRNRLRSWQRNESRHETLPDLAQTEKTENDHAFRIAKAFDHLSEEYEGVLRMKYLEEMTMAEMAKLLNETEKAIESRLTRARQAFREVYS